MEIRKIDEDTFEYWKKVKTVKLSELLEEKERLQAELASLDEPTDAEYIEAGRQTHPFEVNRQLSINGIASIESIIRELQNGINLER